jgi:hypothetical protein
MFNILEHLDKLEIRCNKGTWIDAVCPACGGKLKIANSVKIGAYSCYTNECEKKKPNLIRQKLEPKNSSKAPNTFVAKTFKQYKLKEVVANIKLNASFDSFLTSKAFLRPVVMFNELTGDKLTYYDFGEFRLVRVDRDNEKFFYTEHGDGTNNGLPEPLTTIPVYHIDYVQENVVFAEGEKCASLLQYMGIAGLSFPSIVHDTTMERYVYALVCKGIKNVLFLRDNDNTGIRKARTVCNYFQKYGVGTEIVNLVDFYPQFTNVQGFDIVDLYKAGEIGKNSATELLQKVLCQ